MSGYDVARHLSQHPKLQGLRLIALTSSSEHPGRELAREAGIERYLSQPVGAAELDDLFSQAHNPLLTARPKNTPEQDLSSARPGSAGSLTAPRHGTVIVSFAWGVLC